MDSQQNRVKIILAIGNLPLENFIKDKLVNYADCVGNITHRGSILPTITNCDSKSSKILIYDTDLPYDHKKDISTDELFDTIRVRFPECRIIIMCQKESEKGIITSAFEKGIYDIAVPNAEGKIQIADVFDMIFNPKQYNYARALTGYEAKTDMDLGLQNNKSQPNAYNQNYSAEYQQQYAQQPVNYNTQQYEQTVQYAQTPEMQQIPQQVNQYTQVSDMQQMQNNYYQQNEVAVSNNYSRFNNTVVTYEENSPSVIDFDDGNTSILTSDMTSSKGAAPRRANIRGFIFSKCNEDSVSNSVLYLGNSLPAMVINAKKPGKVIAFTASRQGTGCTSAVINTAYAFADLGKKVLIIDLNFGRSSLYQKLGLPEDYGYSLEDVVKNYRNGNDIEQMPLNKVRLSASSGENIKTIPERISFLKLSDIADYNTSEYISDVINYYKNIYDFIIFDTWLFDAKSPIVREALNLSFKIFLCVVQDIYEVNNAYEKIGLLDNSTYEHVSLAGKIIPYINRCHPKGNPSEAIIRNVFSSNVSVAVESENYGYMSAYSSGIAYYYIATKKEKKVFKDIINLL